MKLSINCVIKNEEDYIEQALAGIIKIADEILIYDTGSTDDTLKILERWKTHHDWLQEKNNTKFDFKVFQGDLSVHEARQFILERSTGDWIMIVDGDEVWGEAEKLLELPQRFPHINAFQFTFNHYLSPDVLSSRHKSKSLRLIKKNPSLHWERGFPREMLFDDKGIYGHRKIGRTDCMFIPDIRFNHYGGIKKHQWRANQPKKFGTPSK